MILMQYSFTLPANYDMGIIDKRIHDKGHMLDGFPGLDFKSYLTARCDSQAPTSRENLYAPFYAWNNNDAISNFLCSPGFAALCQNFGRPNIRTWLAWAHHTRSYIHSARFACRTITPIMSGADLVKLRENTTIQTQKTFETNDNVLAVATGFDPYHWTQVTLALFRNLPAFDNAPETQHYTVGHVSTG